MSKHLTTAAFIKRAKAVHGDRYNYSLAEYQSYHKHVTIICREHGLFTQSPANHFAGKGCPNCGGSKQHTIESFIKAAREVHGDRYNYSQVEYTNNRAEVTIICPYHGAFTQQAKVHLRGNGCPECGGNLKHTNESFIMAAKAVNDERYDYSQSEYKDSHTPLTIICREHGPFPQTPTSHLSGKGCPSCGRNAAREALRSTSEQFIEKAKAIHGDRYDYSLVEYVRNSINVTIICPDHGPFEQAPSDHLSGCGCTKCGGIVRAEARTKSTDEFITDATKVHGDRYDYDLVEYLGANENVTIICSEHGPFEQGANKHLSGSGCYECGRIASNNAKRSSTEEFIAKAMMIHGDRYDYSLVDYYKSSEKVTIICPEHGPFDQIPGDHIGVQKSGCPDCAQTGFNPTKPGLLYYLAVSTDDGDTLYKIGITNLTIEKRFLTHDRSRIRVVKRWVFNVGRDAADREGAILNLFAADKYYGPRVLAGGGNTELFTRDILRLDNQDGLLREPIVDEDANLISRPIQLGFGFRET